MFNNNEPVNAIMPQAANLPQNNIMPQMTQPNCYCVPQETFLCNVKLATAYVPYQMFCSTFAPVEGLDKGTIFPELFSPYAAPDKFTRPPKYE